MPCGHPILSELTKRFQIWNPTFFRAFTSNPLHFVVAVTSFCISLAGIFLSIALSNFEILSKTRCVPSGSQMSRIKSCKYVSVFSNQLLTKQYSLGNFKIQFDLFNNALLFWVNFSLVYLRLSMNSWHLSAIRYEVRSKPKNAQSKSRQGAC